MAKGKGQPTPQELYRARKEKEEEEKDAHLPPGLINHGNTCFMNSTLQGLIATPLLHTLVNFDQLPSSSTSYPAIAARRSPQLTNGHGHGGEYERGWEQGMPLGDVFVTLLQKAWGIQQARTRQSMSPKEILTTIGRKYDQYLDFRQQDAHEFLTHMLDAIRLEEVDLIKKRQPPPPPPPPGKKRRTRHSADTMPEENKLLPFVDMVFGGQLASILVCDTCKKISVTYEDFHDLSLSIQPEDYIKERKRDRFRGIAKKLRLIPKAHSNRSSSVPSSPARSSLNLPSEPIDTPIEVESRRRSLEHMVGGSEQESSREGAGESAGETKVNSGEFEAIHKEETNHVSFTDRSLPTDGEKKEDGWVKLSRRISQSMGGAAKREKRLSRSKSTSRAGSRERVPGTPRVPISGPVIDGRSSDASLPQVASTLPMSSSPLASPNPNHSTGAFPNVRQHSSMALSDLIKHGHLSKPQIRPHKPSREESAYLRQVLADVNPSGSSTFTLIHQALSGNSPSAPLSAQALLVKMGHVPGIEECLRLFTAVEVLDGENMVGCHRCWKIANGTYKPRKQSCEEDIDSEDGDNDADSQSNPILVDPQELLRPSVSRVDTTSSADTNLAGYPSPASTTLISISDTAETSSLFTADSASVSSAPTTVQSAQPVVHTKPAPLPLNAEVPQPPEPSAKTPEAPLPSYGGFPIPSISTTGPDTPLTSPAAVPPNDKLQDDSRLAHISHDSLQPPFVNKRRGKRGSEEEEDGASGDESYDSESDASADASALSDASSLASPSASPAVSPRASVEQLPLAGAAESKAGSGRSKIPRSEQVILRRTYKRYLIAAPPPILIVHLKRFQQTSKSPYTMSFSSGFKKLDNFVSFPEYLDVSPYLAPKKEDFGLGRKKNGKAKKKGENKEKEGECMYRLYAVVVHIGNMLGGHYISYTALPPSSKDQQPAANGAASPSEKTSSNTGARRQWAYISDVSVRLVSLEEVLKAKAYLCMYERI